MKIKLSISLFLITISYLAFALSPVAQNQIAALVQGEPASIQSTAESIYRSGSADVEVTDTMAEIVLQNYASNDQQYTEALSWIVKALGATHNARYQNSLTEALKSPNKNFVKYVKTAIQSLDKANADQYVKGVVNLDDLRSKSLAVSSTQTVSVDRYNKITIVTIGMSMEEVYALCGVATATTSHSTGKAWIPFNFKGGDDVRAVALYKGQGKIIFNKTSQYSTVWKVLQIVIDPNETGYP
jgi:hypothetical protein